MKEVYRLCSKSRICVWGQPLSRWGSDAGSAFFPEGVRIGPVCAALRATIAATCMACPTIITQLKKAIGFRLRVVKRRELATWLWKVLAMARNIVVFSDGTGQDGGVRPEQRISNIYKMYRASRVSFDNGSDPAEQVTFYDPGLGTDIGATALTAPGRFLQKLLSSVDGRGITTNIADCYTFILNHYQPGDRIFLFGFSRGAYTVRSIADLLRLCGVPTTTPDGPLLRFRAQTRHIAEEATLTVLEHGAGHPRGGVLEKERDELARRFREKYGSQHPSGEEQRSNVAPYFIGVFDTVAALGASGARRAIIQTGLYLFTAAAATLGTLLPALLVGLLAQRFTTIPFWPAFLGLQTLAVVGSIIVLRHRQRVAVRKTIRDFPNKGATHSHYAEWTGKNFNRLLSRFVTYARSANAIDETRADFDRVAWGPTVKGAAETAGLPTFQQFFFAGNHSDIGGSYPETESRLSDIALAWMFEQAVKVPDGLRVGPVFANGVQISGTGEVGPALHLYPAADGVQHCEIAATRDALDNIKPRWLARLFRNKNYAVKVRSLSEDATTHPSVQERFSLPGVQQAIGFAPYRPEALRAVRTFEAGYDSIRAKSIAVD